MTKAKFIGKTSTQRSEKQLNRWECPICREDPDKPECRFNLSEKKIDIEWVCKFCKTKLELREKINKEEQFKTYKERAEYLSMINPPNKRHYKAIAEFFGEDETPPLINQTK